MYQEEQDLQELGRLIADQIEIERFRLTRYNNGRIDLNYHYDGIAINIQLCSENVPQIIKALTILNKLPIKGT